VSINLFDSDHYRAHVYMYTHICSADSFINKNKCAKILYTESTLIGLNMDYAVVSQGVNVFDWKIWRTDRKILALAYTALA